MRAFISIIIITLAVLALVGFGWAIVTLAIWTIIAQALLLVAMSKD